MRQALNCIARKAVLSAKSLLAAVVALSVVGVASPAAANSKYAAIVIDANTGKTLYSSSADQPRFPASLTKMMTLYLVFEALRAGKITTETKVPFSAQASAQPPTKLGVRAGGSVSVETIIYSLVTKSANDSATAVGELLGGSEANFARMMTAKARQLGMTGTVFRNANGLPNATQKSTARDMATLGIALREHFPQYYTYFSTRSFAWGKQRLPNHNRLLGRVKGVDGIKTGYTRASGYNLVSSVSDGNRRIVAVVMGGTSGGSRDAQMAALIKKYLPAASTRGGGNLVAKNGAAPAGTLASAMLPKKNAPTPELKPDAETIVVENDAAQDATIAALAKPRKRPTQPVPVVVEQAYAEPSAARMADIDPIRTSSIPTGWAIQIASSPSEVEARAFLAKTKKQAAGAVADADGYTVTFDKDGVTYYRARFGGFGSKTAAWNACSSLKKQKIACYAVQQ